MDNFSLFESEYNKGNLATANVYLMHVMAELLVKDRENFVHLLNESGIEANVTDKDSVLIDKYVSGLVNKKLLLGTAILIAQHNKKMGFNGDESLDDSSIKNIYDSMKVYYADNNYSYAGADPVSAVATALGEGAKLGTAITNKKGKGVEILAQKQQAKQSLVENVLKTRQAQLDAEAKQKESADKNKRVLYIALGVAGVVLVGLIGYKMLKKGK
jgi:excinuclease UvrABC nuclease subunit